MKKLINRLSTFILGDESDFSFEERLILTYIFVASIICFMSIFLNIVANLGVGSILTVTFIFLVFVLAYILGRVYKKAIISKTLFSISALVFCNFYWYFNFGSRGSGTYLFLAFYFVMVFAWDNKQVKIIASLALINISILFICELIKPNLIPFYPSETARITDSYTTLIIIFIFSSIIILSAKNNYIKQFKLAQKSDQLKSSFLANMSHEIRTPLNAITGFSALIAKKDLSPEKKESFSQLINDNSKYLTKLVSDILDFSLIESDQLKISITNFAVNDLMNKLYQTFLQSLKQTGKKGVKLILSVPEQSEIIETDEFRLEQILSNLLSNAVKFTTEGYVKYGYRIESTQVLFFVEDTGRGIKNELKPDIFKRFIKNEEKYEGVFERGAGIGLSLSQEISKLINGTLWFTSEYHKGSTFYLSISSKKIIE